MSNQPERPDWPCGCPNDHRMTTSRAWCSACSEWCYPRDGMLCVRGENVRLTQENERMREVLQRVLNELHDLLLEADPITEG